MRNGFKLALVGILLLVSLAVKAAPIASHGNSPQAGKPRASRTIDWDRTFSNLEKLATISGIIVGGLWAYFKFFRGRVFVPRLDTELSATLSQRAQGDLIIARLKLKNVGLSLVAMHQKGTAIRISACKDDPIGRPGIPQWVKLKVFSVLEHHKWIEAGETIAEEVMIALPASGFIAYRLELRLVGSLAPDGIAPEVKNYAWRDICIVHSFPSDSRGLSRNATKAMRGEQ